MRPNDVVLRDWHTESPVFMRFQTQPSQYWCTGPAAEDGALAAACSSLRSFGSRPLPSMTVE